MNFEDALKALKDGKKIRRIYFIGPSTRKKHYKYFTKENCDKIVTYEDLLAEDWEIIE